MEQLDHGDSTRKLPGLHGIVGRDDANSCADIDIVPPPVRNRHHGRHRRYSERPFKDDGVEGPPTPQRKQQVRVGGRADGEESAVRQHHLHLRGELVMKNLDLDLDGLQRE